MDTVKLRLPGTPSTIRTVLSLHDAKAEWWRMSPELNEPEHVVEDAECRT
jgi:hypothetical protein